jgi:hypothetical protein
MQSYRPYCIGTNRHIKLGNIKHLFRWLYNQGGKPVAVPASNWETPAFAKIKEKKTKRLSPYSETEIWDRDELLLIVKYEPYIRNKAALTLFGIEAIFVIVQESVAGIFISPALLSRYLILTFS